MEEWVKKLAAAFADMFGINIQDMSGMNAALFNVASAVRNLKTSILSSYEEFIANTDYVIPELKSFTSQELKSTKALELLANEIANRQSKFSKWLLNYAPFSTALGKVEKQMRKIEQEAKDTQDKLAETQAENAEIEQANQRGREEVERMNLEAQSAADQANKLIDQQNAAEQKRIAKHNKEVDARLAEANRIEQELDDLRAQGQGTRVTAAWGAKAQRAAEDANDLLQVVNNEIQRKAQRGKDN